MRQVADLYFGTTSVPPLYQANIALSPNTPKSVPLPILPPGTTYYWKVVNKTVANKITVGHTYSFLVP